MSDEHTQATAGLELTLEPSDSGRGKITCTLDGQIVDTDTINLDNARQRGQYAKRLVEVLGKKGWPVDDEELHERLLQMSAKVQCEREEPQLDDGEDTGHERDALPEVSLPGPGHTNNKAAKEFGRHLSAGGKHFVREISVVSVKTAEQGEPWIEPVTASRLCTDAELYMRLVRTDDKGRVFESPMSEAMARIILAAGAFLDQLPIINILAPCPVLIARGNELVEVAGYDRGSGVYASGMATISTDLASAILIINGAIEGFNFPTPSDRSRALAAMISPALIHGWLLGARVPVDLGEADNSQAGKGYRNKITAAIYRSEPLTITQGNGGVGSLRESYDAALVRGAAFISLDNLRGKINEQGLESSLTESRHTARIPYLPPQIINHSRFTIMMTSNQAELTVDMANRCSSVRICKQPDSYVYPRKDGLEILDHVRANQPLYLGAVFSIVREWHRRGRPATQETRHDFRRWAGVLDYIVQEIFHEAPLLDGHRETQDRMSNQYLSWLRQVVLAVVTRELLNTPLRTAQLLDLINEVGGIEIPGLGTNEDLSMEGVRTRVLQSTGRRLTQCFKNKSELEIAPYRLKRGTAMVRAEGHDINVYTVVNTPVAQPAVEG